MHCACGRCGHPIVQPAAFWRRELGEVLGELDESLTRATAACAHAAGFSWERTAAEHLALYRTLVD